LLQFLALQTWPTAADPALVGRLILAAVLGGIIGFEREVAGKPAGLRTNLLICVGAALLTELSIGVATMANLENVRLGIEFRADPARIAAQIVSGIGFLGAGTILQSRGSVVGLTTAATIWVVAAIGMAVGAQAYVIAVGGTVLVYASLALLSRFEAFAEARWGSHQYVVTMAANARALAAVEEAFRSGRLRAATSAIEKAAEHYEVVFEVTGPAAQHEQVIRALVERDDVFRINRSR
jgi:putative Mg2+ transporter-C (MgtC) family protein